VLYRAGQASTNPSEYHLSPRSLATSTVYQDAVRRCQRLLMIGRQPHWCGELAFAPSFDEPPSIEQAARMGIAELADPAHGVNVNPDGPIDWQWNYVTGLWGGHAIPHWWQSALALRTLVRYLEVTNNTSPGFQTILMRTYEREDPLPFAIAKSHFVNDFGDDTAWWGLAWLEASKYELNYRHDQSAARKFLWLAEYDANYLEKLPKACGGIVWKVHYPPDTVTGAEYAALVAGLYGYRNTSGPFHDSDRASHWLDQARSTIAWLESKRLINVRTGKIRDRLDPTCKHLIAGGITYTQGQVAAAFVALGSALHDNKYYTQANAFLHYAVSPQSGFVHGGNQVLQEPCERNRDGCTGNPDYLDLLSWKGILIQALSDYRTATGSTEYDWFIRRQAGAVVDNAIRQTNGQPGNCDAPEDCQFVFYWAWPLSPVRSGFVNVATQMNALDALTAALALPPSS
jgi:hypothetical protein